MGTTYLDQIKNKQSIDLVLAQSRTAQKTLGTTNFDYWERTVAVTKRFSGYSKRITFQCCSKA